MCICGCVCETECGHGSIDAWKTDRSPTGLCQFWCCPSECAVESFNGVPPFLNIFIYTLNSSKKNLLGKVDDFSQRKEKKEKKKKKRKSV